MRTEMVEIYSDASNAAIMRHPGRKFPGMLIQGDSLNRLSMMATAAFAEAKRGSEQYYELKMLSEELQERVNFYAKVLTDHGLHLPFETLPHSLRR